MSTDSSNNTRDISNGVLTKLVKETDRLVRLADDIDTHASTPQAKAAFNLIGSEVSNNIPPIMKSSLDPLYRLYDLDPGMKNLDRNRRNATIKDFTAASKPTIVMMSKPYGMTSKPKSLCFIELPGWLELVDAGSGDCFRSLPPFC